MNYNKFNFRADFPLFSSSDSATVYLDFASSAQTPKMVIDKMNAYYNECRANVHRGMYPLSVEATERYEQARLIMAKFLNASAAEIIFTRGTTESLNLLAYSLTKDLMAGDEIVITALEHHANLVPWQQLAQERDLVLKFIELTPDFEVNLTDAKAKITSKTKIVSTTLISNVLGGAVAIKDLMALAHGVGAVAVVDAAQAVGHRVVDVQALNCDFLAMSGHKMYGPTGIGILFGKAELLEKLPPFMFGGDMIREVWRQQSSWSEIPTKFEPGTPNIAGAIGLAAAGEYLNEIGLGKIREHELDLTKYALEQLEQINGLEIIGPKFSGERAGVISFVLNGVHPHDLADLLGQKNICVRAGHHCAMPLLRTLNLADGVTRASLGITSTGADIDQLVAAIIEIKNKFKV